MEQQPQGITAEKHQSMPDPITVTLASGEALWFQRFRGVVIEESKRSESSSVAGSSISSGPSGVIVDAFANTHHERTHSIWLRSDTGIEREIGLPSHDFSTRVGHDVSVSWGAREGLDSGHCVAAVNHTTGTVWKLSFTMQSCEPDVIESFLSVDKSLFWPRVLLVSLGLVVGSGVIAAVFSSLKDAVLLSFIMACGPAEIAALVWAVTRATREGVAKSKVVDSCIGALANSLREDAGHRSNQEISAQLLASASATR